MSQPSTPYHGTETDLFREQEYASSAQQHARYYEFNPADHASLSFDNSAVFSDVDNPFDNASLTYLDASSSSTVSTPNFSTNNLGLPSPAYSTPGPDFSYAHPLERYHPYEVTSNASSPHQNQHPVAIRAHAHTAYPQHFIQYPHAVIRRRSLSHGDVDRIAAARSVPNPTFMRLQAPKNRSTAPEDKRKKTPYALHARSASHGPSPSPKRRGIPRASTPYMMPSSPLVGGMIPTPIGTPMPGLMDLDDFGIPVDASRCRAYDVDIAETLHSGNTASPIVRHMTRPKELARSRNIIEIGAMAVREVAKLDPRLEEETSTAISRHCIFQKLDEIETYLRERNDEGIADALRGCAIIREALAENLVEPEVVETVEDVKENGLTAPSTVFAEVGQNIFAGEFEGNALMGLSSQEIGSP